MSRVTTASLSIALQAIPPHETGCERFAILQHVPRHQWTSLDFLNDNRDNGNNIYIAQGCARVVSVVPVGLCCHLKTDTTLSTKKQTGRHSLLREHLPVCFFPLIGKRFVCSFVNKLCKVTNLFYISQIIWRLFYYIFVAYFKMSVFLLIKNRDIFLSLMVWYITRCVMFRPYFQEVWSKQEAGVCPVI